MIVVSGRTFQYKQLLRMLGGSFVSNGVWQFDDLLPHEIDELRACVGLFINVIPDPPKPPSRRNRTPVQIGDDFTYFNHFKDKDPICYIGFSSLSRFVDHVAGLTMPDNSGGLCDIGWTAKPGYAGTDDMAHALMLARRGWLDGLGLADRLLPPPPRRKRSTRAVAGGKVNVGRILAGAPDCMSKRRPLPGRKVITIFVEAVMWEGIKIDTALLRVVAIAAIVDRLEHEGYSCEVVSVYCAFGLDHVSAQQIVVKLKSAGERLSLADISFAFGHPSYGRRLAYAAKGVVAQCDMTRESRGYISEAFNYGYPTKPNEFYIPQIRSNYNTISPIIERIVPANLPIEIRI